MKKIILVIIFLILLSSSIYAESGRLEMDKECDFIGYNSEINKLFFWCSTDLEDACGADNELTAVDPWSFEEEFMVAMPGLPGLILTTANGGELIFTTTNFESTETDFGSRAKLIKVEIASGVILDVMDYGFGSLALSILETKDHAFVLGSLNTFLFPSDVEDTVEPEDQVGTWVIDKNDFTKSIDVEMDYMHVIHDGVVSGEKIYFSPIRDFMAEAQMINFNNPGILYIYDTSKTSVLDPAAYNAKTWKDDLNESLINQISFDGPIHRIITGKDKQIFVVTVNIEEKKSQVFALDPKTDTLTKIFSQYNVLLIDPGVIVKCCVWGQLGDAPLLLDSIHKNNSQNDIMNKFRFV